MELKKGSKDKLFHQPGVWIINQEGEALWGSNIVSKVGNGFGVTGRPEPAKVMQVAVELSKGEKPKKTPEKIGRTGFFSFF